MFPTLL